MPFIIQGKTNWKFLLIIFILAAIVGGGTLGYYLLSKQEVKAPEIVVPESNPLSECDKIQDKNDKALCYLKIAKTKEDLSICDKIQDQNYKDSCYWQFAVPKGDLSICDKIQGQDSKDTCYQQIAEAKKDPSICDKIQDQGFKDSCYQWVAAVKEDLSICDKIYYQYDKDSCYRDVAVAKEDPSICDKIQGQSSKDSCYYQVAVPKKDPSICDKILQEQVYKDYCYQKVAVAKEDSSICDKIQNQDKKDSCYWDIAVAKEDPSICDKIPDQGNKDSCYADVAETKEDPSICNKIQNQDKKDSCYRDIVLSKEDLSICDKIQDQTDKDGCYRWVAVAKEDLSICDKIQDQDIKNKCYGEEKLTGRPIWDETSQENCWYTYNGEIFGAEEDYKGILNFGRSDVIKPVKFLNAKYKGLNYYFQINEQTKIIFENESIILEKSGIRKVLSDDIDLEWPIYDFQNSIKLWEYFKEDDCKHFVVFSTLSPNVFLISGYESASGGGFWQRNYYFYLDVEKEKIILPVEFMHSISSIMSGNAENYNISVAINNKSILDVRISCSGHFLSDDLSSPENYDASMDVLVDDETIYTDDTDDLENMCGWGQAETFFNGFNQNFSGFYFTIAETNENSDLKKIQYFFNLSDMRIEKLE